MIDRSKDLRWETHRSGRSVDIILTNVRTGKVVHRAGKEGEEAQIRKWMLEDIEETEDQD